VENIELKIKSLLWIFANWTDKTYKPEKNVSWTTCLPIKYHLDIKCVKTEWEKGEIQFSSLEIFWQLQQDMTNNVLISFEMYIYIYIYMYICIHTYLYICMCMYIWTHLCRYICEHIYIKYYICNLLFYQLDYIYVIWR
jgi:hypothetical protein